MQKKHDKHNSKQIESQRSQNDMAPVDGELIEALEKTLDLDKEQITKVRTVVMQQQTHYKGPLPHPEILKSFKEISPELFDLILSNFSKEGDHRRQLEEKIVEAEINQNKEETRIYSRGQIFAFLITLIIVITVLLLAYMDKQIAASIVGSTAFVSIVCAFLAGRSNTKDSLDKPKESEEDNKE